MTRGSSVIRLEAARSSSILLDPCSSLLEYLLLLAELAVNVSTRPQSALPSNMTEVGPPHKRQRGETTALAVYQDEGPRTSSLPAPTLQLSGHTGSVYALAYNPTGEVLASASFDKTILLWSHSNYENFNQLVGHKNAVLDSAWCDDETLVTVGADHLVLLWDAETGTRLRQWKEHTGVVNACHGVGETQVVTASDDGACILWDRRQKSSVGLLSDDRDLPQTAVAATDTHVYTGGIDNWITCWDLRLSKKSYSMKGHTDTVASLAIHPESTHLLSHSLDQTLRIWDIGNYSSGPKRLCKTFAGQHKVQKALLKCAWSSDGRLITAGSSDQMVHIWDEFSEQELYLLPGHQGCVNTVVFHPKENVIASGSSDKQILIGELS